MGGAKKVKLDNPRDKAKVQGAEPENGPVSRAFVVGPWFKKCGQSSENEVRAGRGSLRGQGHVERWSLERSLTLGKEVGAQF